MSPVGSRGPVSWTLDRLLTREETHANSSIDSEGDDILDLDGEIKGAPPISLKVLPRAVEVFA